MKKKTHRVTSLFNQYNLHFQFLSIDLLVIEENKPASRRMDYQRQGGDWFEHNNNNDIKNNNKNETTRPASASGRRPAPTNGHQK